MTILVGYEYLELLNYNISQFEQTPIDNENN